MTWKKYKTQTTLSTTIQHLKVLLRCLNKDKINTPSVMTDNMINITISNITKIIPKSRIM